MPISTQDVAGMYNPLIASLDEGGYKDTQASQANINFDKRVARSAYPITRMFDPSGKVNKAAIANASPAGKQIYDMNLVNQLDMMRRSGMSEKRIKSQFDENPEMRQYMYENGMLEMPQRGMSIGKHLAIGGGMYGLMKGAQYLGPAHVGDEAQKSLRALGLEYSKKYKSVVPMNDKALTAKFVKEGMSKTEAAAESKKVRDALAKNKKSFWGKQALKAGGGTGKRIGTRAVLGNIAKTVGPKAGTGLLAWAGRAVTSANPYGLAANVLLLAAPYIIGKMSDKDKVADDESMWR